jgi:hypothetical protein
MNRTLEINTPYEVTYNSGRVIRHENGKPVYLWEILLFEKEEDVKKFVKEKRFGRYFEKGGRA